MLGCRSSDLQRSSNKIVPGFRVWCLAAGVANLLMTLTHLEYSHRGFSRLVTKQQVSAADLLSIPIEWGCSAESCCCFQGSLRANGEANKEALLDVARLRGR